MSIAILAALRVGKCFVLLPEPKLRIAKLQMPDVKPRDKNLGFILEKCIISGLGLQDIQPRSKMIIL